MPKSITRLLAILIIVHISCKSKPKDPIAKGESIIKKSIEASGSNKLKNAKLNFSFRGNQYLANRNNGKFVLARFMVSDSKDSIFDVLSNDGFERFVNDSLVQLPDTLIARFSPSVNSVHYFSVLPYGLDAKAVNTEWLSDEKIKEETYHKVKITFDEVGGGEDFEDVFIYWINTETFKIDYLAYSYEERDGKGLRFREAYNRREIEGIDFVDYNNFKPKVATVDLGNLGKLFANGELELLSKIELENISVDLINDL